MKENILLDLSDKICFCPIVFEGEIISNEHV